MLNEVCVYEDSLSTWMLIFKFNAHALEWLTCYEVVYYMDVTQERRGRGRRVE